MKTSKLVKQLIISTSACFIIVFIPLSAQVPHFTRIDTGSLSNEIIRGRGLYVVDFNMDGLLDLYIGNSTGIRNGLNRPNLLFMNTGNGNFINANDSLISSRIYEHNSGSNWADLDNDGDPDLYNDGEIFLNDGSGSFYYGKKVTDRNEVNAVWIDLNNDGYVDLLTNVYFGANYAYLNNGDGSFRETPAGDFTAKGIGGSQSFSMADADNDGDMDVLEANLCLFGACDPLIPNTLYLNNNNGSFTVADSTCSLMSEAMQSPGSSWGDYDNDGDMDVYVLSMADKKDILFQNEGNLRFTPITLDPEKESYKFSYNSSWGDLNNDGYLDLFVSVVPDGNAMCPECSWFNNMLYLNRGDGGFYRVKSSDIINDGGEPHVMNDFDNDGDLDIIIGHGNGALPFRVFVYLNEGNENHWLNISCEGTQSNRSAIGTRIKVKAKIGEESEWMMREISQENGIHACNGPRLHFGLGEAEKADSVIIRWPSGQVDVYTDIGADHFYEAVENTGIERDIRIDP